MPRVTLAKLRKRARDQQRKKEVAASCRSQTVYTAPGPAERIDRVAGPFIKGNDGEDDEVTGERGGVVLRAAPEDGGAVILQRLSQSSHSQLVRFKRDAKEFRRLKETLQEELEAREEEHDLELDNDALALGLCVRDVESVPPSDRKGENMTANPTRATTVPTKEWQLTSSHLLAQKECNDFLAALRALTYNYVDFLEPLFHDELRNMLDKREAGFQRLKKTVGEEQMRFLDGCAWTGIRILEEGSRTAWQAYEDDASPTLLLTFGPRLILELEHASLELEEGQICLFDSRLPHRLLISTVKKKGRKKHSDWQERPWAVCLFAEGLILGEAERDGEGDSVLWVANKDRMLENPPGVLELGQRRKKVRT